MLIRLAATGDVPAIAALVRGYWEFEAIGGFEPQRIEGLLGRLLSEPARGACWVADAQGTLCGYLLAVYMFSLEHGGTMAEIDEVYVAPQARSAGAGALLIERAQRDMSAQGLVRLQLQLGVGNVRARMFYQRHGFAARAGYELLDKPLAEPPR